MECLGLFALGRDCNICPPLWANAGFYYTGECNLVCFGGLYRGGASGNATATATNTRAGAQLFAWFTDIYDETEHFGNVQRPLYHDKALTWRLMPVTLAASIRGRRWPWSVVVCCVDSSYPSFSLPEKSKRIGATGR